jgi:hypothetical protein
MPGYPQQPYGYPVGFPSQGYPPPAGYGYPGYPQSMGYIPHPSPIPPQGNQIQLLTHEFSSFNKSKLLDKKQINQIWKNHENIIKDVKFDNENKKIIVTYSPEDGWNDVRKLIQE